MGILDSIFGGKKELSSLDSNSSAAKHIESMQEPLAKFCQETADNIELIPSTQSAYLFLGSPPKRFAISWIDQDGTVHNFKKLVEEKGVPQTKLERMVGLLGNAYRESKQEERYAIELGGKNITVTPSESLASKIKNVIEDVTN